MLANVYHGALHLWEGANDLSTVLFRCRIVDLVNKINEIVKSCLQFTIAVFCMWYNAPMMICGILIGVCYPTPDSISNVIQTIQNIAIKIKRQHEYWQIISLGFIAAAGFEFSIQVLTFFIGAYKGVGLRKLPTTVNSQ
jgi:hypothetical protein